MDQNLSLFLQRANDLLTRLEPLLPPSTAIVDATQFTAFRWRKQFGRGYLQGIAHPHLLRLDDLHVISVQKQQINQNTQQFVRGLPANNLLLWGSRGTGKSSLIKAVLQEYAADGLRMIEVDKDDLVDIPDIVELIQGLPQRFIIFCDDLSFESGDASYKALKAILDGSLAGTPDNILVYATSNRRHLLPESMRDNLSARVDESGELHEAEAVEEKISLSERFGLWVAFHPFTQAHYLEVVLHWLNAMGYHCSTLDEPIEKQALQFALRRGSRSGRVAVQFARQFVGEQALK